MVECEYCGHELIQIREAGWQHIRHDGINCMEPHKGYPCGCDCPFPKRDDAE